MDSFSPLYVIAGIVLFPFAVYVTAKLVTFGHLAAKQRFEEINTKTKQDHGKKKED